MELGLRVRLLGIAAGALLRLVRITQRWEWEHIEPGESLWGEGPPRIVAFWHRQQIQMPYVYLGTGSRKKLRPIYALTSQHGDGRLAASLMRALGLRSVAGSSSRGGVRALLEMVRVLKGGGHVAVTPDGPRGPLFSVKPGVIKVAQKSGVPILPLALAAAHQVTFRSWDRMFLALPFSRVAAATGHLIKVPSECTELELEQYRQQLEREINWLSARVEARAGKGQGTQASHDRL
ncbi:MAG: lysophospholipid acyltransferase family protein [Oligoflexia bacterium]|nr:lysophospholipid acyltransferase family protein [Oligoflexia bacterium]